MGRRETSKRVPAQFGIGSSSRPADTSRLSDAPFAMTWCGDTGSRVIGPPDWGAEGRCHLVRWALVSGFDLDFAVQACDVYVAFFGIELAILFPINLDRLDQKFVRMAEAGLDLCGLIS